MTRREPCSSEDARAALAWARAHARSLASPPARRGPPSDQRPLGPPGGAWGSQAAEAIAAFVGDARLVALGQSAHTARQQQELALRVAWLLATRLGFSVLAFEESHGSVARLDAFVAGGPGDPAALLRACGLRDVWATETMLAFLVALRALNSARSAEESVRLVGVDIGSPAAGLEQLRAGLAAARTELGVEWHRANLGDDLWHDASWQRTAERFGAASTAVVSALRTKLRRLRGALEPERRRAAGTPRDADSGMLATLHGLARQAELAAHMYAAMAGGRWLPAINLRDAAMAEGLLALLELRRRQRVVFVSHNGHVCRAARRVPDSRLNGRMLPTGRWLARRLGDSLVSVGLTAGRGTVRTAERTASLGEPLPGSADWALDRLGAAPTLVDLRALPEDGPAARWWGLKRPLRYETDYEEHWLPRAFDGLLSVDRVEPTRLLRG